MTGLSGSAAQAEAERLAELHSVDRKHIYRITEDLRGRRKKRRADAGNRKFELVPGSDVWYAASLVIADKLDLALALETARLRGRPNLPSLEYFRQMLAEKHLGSRSRKNPLRGHREFQAEFPGQMFQIDCTALKVRWRDEKTRRILRIEGIDKNHPQLDPHILRVWQLMLIDDHSRRRFLRYIVARAVTSAEMVRFISEAYCELGVPHLLYTDGGGEFKGRHTDAAKILNMLPTIAETGGYRHLAHLPNNAQATGKVETAHKWAEKMDRLVGLAVSEGRNVTLESLNTFAEQICIHYNNRVHSKTGETPMARWHGKRSLIRRLDPTVIESALLSRTFEPRLEASMTVRLDKVEYKVPGVRPFVDHIGHKLRVVAPGAIDHLLICLPDAAGKFSKLADGDFWVLKVPAAADAAGEFRRVAETSAEILRGQLRATRKANIAEIKEQNATTGEIEPIPFFDVPAAIPETNITHFPQPERIATAAEINKVVPVLPTGTDDAQPVERPSRPAAYIGRPIGYWQAVAEYSSRFSGGVEEAKEFLLAMFPDFEGTKPSGEIEAAIERRTEEATPGLRAVG